MAKSVMGTMAGAISEIRCASISSQPQQPAGQAMAKIYIRLEARPGLIVAKNFKLSLAVASAITPHQAITGGQLGESLLAIDLQNNLGGQFMNYALLLTFTFFATTSFGEDFSLFKNSMGDYKAYCEGDCKIIKGRDWIRYSETESGNILALFNSYEQQTNTCINGGGVTWLSTPINLACHGSEIEKCAAHCRLPNGSVRPFEKNDLLRVKWNASAFFEAFLGMVKECLEEGGQVLNPKTGELNSYECTPK